MSISTASKQAGAGTSQSGKAWVLLAVSLGQFLIQLDLTIVNVALPAIGRDLGTSAPRVHPW
jgi:DHA2 family methylenomycin A resistance protein-like MFS transporter